MSPVRSARESRVRKPAPLLELRQFLVDDLHDLWEGERCCFGAATEVAVPMEAFLYLSKPLSHAQSPLVRSRLHTRWSLSHPHGCFP